MNLLLAVLFGLALCSEFKFIDDLFAGEEAKELKLVLNSYNYYIPDLTCLQHFFAQCHTIAYNPIKIIV